MKTKTELAAHAAKYKYLIAFDDQVAFIKKAHDLRVWTGAHYVKVTRKAATALMVAALDKTKDELTGYRVDTGAINFITYIGKKT